MKVFLDTNVLASAFTTRGLCADLFRAVVAEHDMIVGEAVLKELERVLRHKFRLPNDTAADILRLLRDFPIVAVPKEIHSIALRDLDDIPIVASAIAASADFFVTGDKELLTLRANIPLRIVSSRQMWDAMRAGRI